MFLGAEKNWISQGLIADKTCVVASLFINGEESILLHNNIIISMYSLLLFFLFIYHLFLNLCSR